MKVCFDTSVLVAALLKEHPQHALAFPKLKAVHQGEIRGAITTHARAEAFATLTALPLKPKLPPAEVRRLLERNLDRHFEMIALTPAIYATAIDLTAEHGLSSGAIFDALHLVGARSANCNQMLTFNLKHFRSLAPQDPMVVCP